MRIGVDVPCVEPPCTPVQTWYNALKRDVRTAKALQAERADLIAIERPWEMKTLNGIAEQRRAIRPLLAPNDPADAMASYYALWHDARRTELRLHTV